MPAELLSGFGGMLSFRLVGGTEDAEGLFEALRLPCRVESRWGGGIDHPAGNHVPRRDERP
ncbi:MAG: PLP-dependent aspartate aminotransferase family protein [Actinomycetota bacterium]|nr:PLP-dependent aspartate aminotransferase family protein [Actinomycetota bacterium]